MSYLELIPAYGRDYTSAKTAQADWDAGKDFIIADIFNQWDGKPINKPHADEAGYKVMLRYNQLRSVTVVC